MDDTVNGVEASDDAGRLDATLKALECQKREVELAKLRAEEAHASLAWWKRPAYLGALVPVLLSLLGLVTMTTRGFFDDRVERANEEVKKAEGKVDDLNKQRIDLQNSVAELNASTADSYSALAATKTYMLELERESRQLQQGAQEEKTRLEKELGDLGRTVAQEKAYREAIIAIGNAGGELFIREFGGEVGHAIVFAEREREERLQEPSFGHEESPEDRRLYLETGYRYGFQAKRITVEDLPNRGTQRAQRVIDTAALRAIAAIPNAHLTLGSSYDAANALSQLKPESRIRGLRIWSDHITDSELRPISRLSALREVYLEGKKITDSGVKYLSGLIELWQLELRSTQITDESIKTLEALPKLRYLDIGGTRISAPGIRQLTKKFPNADIPVDPTSLLGRAPDKGRWTAEIDDEFNVTSVIAYGVTLSDLEHLKKIASLKRLVLVDTKVSPKAFTYFGSMQGLTTLELYHAKGEISDAGLASLGNQHQLTSLVIAENDSDVELSETGIMHLANLKDLRQLRLILRIRRADTSQNPLSGDAWSHLAQLGNLEILELELSPYLDDSVLKHVRSLQQLKHLSLRYADIADSGLEHLADLTALESLDLSGSQITDLGLTHLGALEQLRWIKLENTKVTLKGVRRAGLLGNRSNQEVLNIFADIKVDMDQDATGINIRQTDALTDAALVALVAQIPERAKVESIDLGYDYEPLLVLKREYQALVNAFGQGTEVRWSEPTPSDYASAAEYLSASPHEWQRDGKRALELALHACSRAKNDAACLAARAAAHAELGDFDKAIEFQQLAIEALPMEYEKFEFQARLRNYREQKPLRWGKVSVPDTAPD